MVLKMTITRRAAAETGLSSRAPRYRTVRETAARTAAASRNKTDRLLIGGSSRRAPRDHRDADRCHRARPRSALEAHAVLQPEIHVNAFLDVPHPHAVARTGLNQA